MVAIVAVVMNLPSKSGGSAIKDPIDVVKVLTCDSNKAYEILSGYENACEADVYEPSDPDYTYAQENAPIFFTSSSDLVEMVGISWASDYDCSHKGSEYEDLSENDEYVALSGKVYGKPSYVCRIHTRYGSYLSRSSFQQDSMPELSFAELALFIPVGEELDCETLANYIQPFVPSEQCYVVQTDNDHFEGGLKGGGCVSRIDAYKTTDYDTGDFEYWNVDVTVSSISRDDANMVVSSDFDMAYSALNTANYLDSYVE